MPDRIVDCQGCIVAPGFIDIQINGAFGVDFSCDVTDKETGEHVLRKIGQGILAHGVTAYCPTVVTSPPSVYRSVLPHLPRASGGVHGAAVLGVHVEGPFISTQKKGAHPEEHIACPSNGIRSLDEVYGDGLENVALITLAPELEWAMEVMFMFNFWNIEKSSFPGDRGLRHQRHCGVSGSYNVNHFSGRSKLNLLLCSTTTCSGRRSSETRCSTGDPPVQRHAKLPSQGPWPCRSPCFGETGQQPGYSHLCSLLNLYPASKASFELLHIHF